jgi:ubiquitin C-terminal hydrolase
MLIKFKGKDQHDAQELLAYIIDALHEDLNKVIKKKYISMKDFVPGTPEDDFFKSFNANHLANNDSFIQDLFYGKFRTVTT